MNAKRIGKGIYRQTQNKPQKYQHGTWRVVGQQQQKDQVIKWRYHPEYQDMIEYQHLQ